MDLVARMQVVTLASTVLLLAVTFWYAVTTKKMADTAAKAAEESARATAAAEKAAEAAHDAAAVAQSQINPDFEGRFASVIRPDEEGGYTACLQMRSVGDAVVVQSVKMLRAFREDESGNESLEVPTLTGAELIPFREASLPLRLHARETFLLTHDEFQRETQLFTRLIMEVSYTFVEGGSTGGKRMLVVDADALKWNQG